ncbi:hypothetical protein [Celeribacter sp. ULVN23_4]
MKTIPLSIIAILLGGMTLWVAPAHAQQRPQGPDIGALAQKLGVSEAALQGCMGERPKPGQQPERPDAAKLAACLTDAGSTVSSDAVDAALREMTPPPPRQ